MCCVFFSYYSNFKQLADTTLYINRYDWVLFLYLKKSDLVLFQRDFLHEWWLSIPSVYFNISYFQCVIMTSIQTIFKIVSDQIEFGNLRKHFSYKFQIKLWT